MKLFKRRKEKYEFYILQIGIWYDMQDALNKETLRLQKEGWEIAGNVTISGMQEREFAYLPFKRKLKY